MGHAFYNYEKAAFFQGKKKKGIVIQQKVPLSRTSQETGEQNNQQVQYSTVTSQTALVLSLCT